MCSMLQHATVAQHEWCRFFVFVGEDDNFRPRYLAIDHHTDIMSHGLLLLDKFLVRLDLD